MAVRRRPDVSTPRPASPAPAKPQLNVEDWEAKALLDDNTSQYFVNLKRACEQRPLPLKFAEEVEVSSRPSTPKAILSPSSRPGTPINGFVQGQTGPANAHHPLHPTQPISTPQQFYDWFGIVERTISHSQESHFRNYLHSVEEHLARCDLMRERIVQVEEQVRDMLHEWQNVEEGADSLQAACEKLLEERDRLLEASDSIAVRMEYYEELEHATQMLNHPGEALVLQTHFLLMVERVDVCIEYFQDHRHFSEAEVYLLRFQQCMTRAMTLIKMYFIGSLRALSTDVHRRIAETELSDTAETHLLYSKFIAVSGPTAPLLAELERRAIAHPDELSSLLAECQSAYFSSRKALIGARLTREIRMLDPSGSDLVELTRAGCSFLKQLCTDEFELYRRFFNSGEDKLYRYLEGLCDYLYDDLRPRILHEPQLTVLCQVCTVLQALMVLDVPSGDGGEYDEDEDVQAPTVFEGVDALKTDRSLAARLISFVGAGPETPKPLRRLHVSQLLQMILQDAQTRLFFKAQAIVQAEIRYYAPTKDDLDYPAKLIAARQGPEEGKPAMTIVGTGPEDELFASLSSRGSVATWYPTLQKLHWILGLLYDFVKPAIFDDMAIEAASMCRHSLVSASQLLVPQSSDIDARLFLVRHLLVLKEILNILNGRHDGASMRKPPHEPWASGTDTLGSLLRGTTSIFNGNIILGGLAALSTPRESDIRVAVDEDLKRVCEELIGSCSDRATLPLRASSSGLKSAQPATSTPTAGGTLDAFKKMCESEIKSWLSKVRIYLDDPDPKTVDILVAAVHASIVRQYEGWIQSRAGKDGESTEVLSSSELWNLLRSWSDESTVSLPAGGKS